ALSAVVQDNQTRTAESRIAFAGGVDCSCAAHRIAAAAVCGHKPGEGIRERASDGDTAAAATTAVGVAGSTIGGDYTGARQCSHAEVDAPAGAPARARTAAGIATRGDSPIHFQRSRHRKANRSAAGASRSDWPRSG